MINLKFTPLEFGFLYAIVIEQEHDSELLEVIKLKLKIKATESYLKYPHLKEKCLEDIKKFKEELKQYE